MDSKKEDYKSLKDKIEKISQKKEELDSELDVEKKQSIIIQTEIRTIQKEIDLYDSGKCPTCKTDFISDHFQSLRETLSEKKKQLEGIKEESDLNIQKVIS